MPTPLTSMHNVLIIGKGLAALSAAARLTELGVSGITVCAAGLGGTPYIAAINFVHPESPYEDSAELYEKDMLSAGFNLGNREIVNEMTRRNMDAYDMLVRWGVVFARNPDGNIKLRLVSGHTYPRTCCCTDRLIGYEFIDKFIPRLTEKGVQFRDCMRCLHLLTENGRVVGATFMNEETGKTENIYAALVIAAWGGIGNLFCRSTYPEDIQGTTLAMAHRAGAELVDVEFLEYEPMVVQYPESAVGEPCPTAMLGEGAHLLNSDGERFMLAVRPQGEGGSPKTLLNREIWKQLDAGKGSPHGGVYADMRHIDPKVLYGYPWFCDRLATGGYDPCKDLIEVGPMAHSFSGGIRVNKDYAASVPGLYAVGEASGGTHGACRCAGNAASQAAISGMLCAEAIARAGIQEITPSVQHAEWKQNAEIFEKYVPEARELARKALAICRKEEVLANTDERLTAMRAQSELEQDENAAQILESIHIMVQAARKRRETRGTHMRSDFPEQLEEYAVSMIVK